MIKIETLDGKVTYLNPQRIDGIDGCDEGSIIYQSDGGFKSTTPPEHLARLINQWYKDHLQAQTHMMRGMI